MTRPIAKPSRAPSTRVTAVSRNRLSKRTTKTDGSVPEQNVDGGIERKRMQNSGGVHDDGDEQNSGGARTRPFPTPVMMRRDGMNTAPAARLPAHKNISREMVVSRWHWSLVLVVSLGR